MKSVFQLVLPNNLPRPTDLLTIGVVPLPPIGCRKVHDWAWADPASPPRAMARASRAMGPLRRQAGEPTGRSK